MNKYTYMYFYNSKTERPGSIQMSIMNYIQNVHDINISICPALVRCRYELSTVHT